MHNKAKHKTKCTFRIEGNICKGRNWQRVNLENIQAARAAQLKKNKQTNKQKKTALKKWGEKPKQPILQGRPTDGQRTHEKCSQCSLYIKKNTSKNHNEVSLTSHWSE